MHFSIVQRRLLVAFINLPGLFRDLLAMFLVYKMHNSWENRYTMDRAAKLNAEKRAQIVAQDEVNLFLGEIGNNTYGPISGMSTVSTPRDDDYICKTSCDSHDPTERNGYQLYNVQLVKSQSRQSGTGKCQNEIDLFISHKKTYKKFRGICAHSE